MPWVKSLNWNSTTTSHPRVNAVPMSLASAPARLPGHEVVFDLYLEFIVWLGEMLKIAVDHLIHNTLTSADDYNAAEEALLSRVYERCSQPGSWEGRQGLRKAVEGLHQGCSPNYGMISLTSALNPIRNRQR